MTTTPYYEDDCVTLYHGDCREVLPGVDLPAIDCVVTDPPYGETGLDWDSWPTGWPSVMATITNSMWCFGSARMFDTYRDDLLADWKMSQDLIWSKGRGVGSVTDRFMRTHEHVRHYYHGPWGETYHESPREDSYGTRKRKPVHRPATASKSLLRADRKAPRPRRPGLWWCRMKRIIRWLLSDSYHAHNANVRASIEREEALMPHDATLQEIRMAAWFDGYWAACQDEEYATDTPCPFGPWDSEGYTRASYAPDEVDRIASVMDWGARLNRQSLHEAHRQQREAASSNYRARTDTGTSVSSRPVDPHSRHPHAHDGECIHGYDEKRYIWQDYHSGERRTDNWFPL